MVSIDDGPLMTIKGTHLISFEKKAVMNDTLYLNLNHAVSKIPLYFFGHSLALLHENCYAKILVASRT